MPFRFVSFVFAAAVALVLGTPQALCAQGDGAPDGCDKLAAAFRESELRPGGHIEILLAAGNTVPPELRSTYEEMATETLKCIGDNSHVEIIPITDEGVAVAPAFSGIMPGAQPNDTNPIRIRIEREQFVKLAAAKVHEIVNAQRNYTGFDPLGTLYAAGDSLRQAQSGAKLLVLLIGNGWQQTKPVNLYRYHDNPAMHSAEIVNMLRTARTLPKLYGSDVVVAGVTRGNPRMKMADREIAGLCRFWEEIIHASGGTMLTQYCKVTLPGLTAPY
jgi:hypothetical protein